MRHQLRLLPAGAQAQDRGLICALAPAYHFTVGGPVDDPRLTTLPPYGAQVKGRKGAMDLP